MSKKLVKALFAFALISMFVLAACSADPDADGDSETVSEQEGETSESSESGEDSNSGEVKDELEIVWIHMQSAAQSEQRAKEGFEEFIEQNGYNWNVSYLDSKGSGQNVASNIEDAVQRGVDAIITSMTDLRASKASIEEAEKAGIPIFAVDSGWTPGLVVDVTSNNYLMSAKVSSYLVDRLGGEGKIVAFKMAEHHGVRKRGSILDVIVEENPGIEIIAEHNMDYSDFYNDTLQTMEDYLARYGDEIDAVWTGWDEPAMAAAAAIQAAGFSKEDMFVTGIDGHGPAIDEMREGSPVVATVAQGFEVMGERVGEYIFEIVSQGKPINEIIQSTTVYVDTPLITEFNIPEEGEPPYLGEDFYSSN